MVAPLSSETIFTPHVAELNFACETCAWICSATSLTVAGLFVLSAAAANQAEQRQVNNIECSRIGTFYVPAIGKNEKKENRTFARGAKVRCLRLTLRDCLASRDQESDQYSQC